MSAEEKTTDNFTKAALQKALKEVDKVLGTVKPPIELDVDKDGLVEQLLELSGLLKPKDKLTAKTRSILSQLKDSEEDAPADEPDDDPEDPEDPADDAGDEPAPEEKRKPAPKRETKKTAKKGPGKIERLIAYLTPLVESGKHTRKDLHAKAVAKFEGEIPAGTVSAQLYRVTREDAKENRWGFVASYDPETKILKATKKRPS